MRGVSVRARPRLPARLAAPDRRPTLYSPGDECDRQPRPQELDPPRDRGSRRPVRPRRPRRRRAPVPPHAGRRASAPARPRGRSSSASSGPTAIVDEAVEHLVQDAYREAIIEQGIVPLTNADVEIVDAEEGKPLRFKATVQVRPEVQLGDYTQFNFAPEIETIDEPKVDKVVEELRDQNAQLAAVEDRAAKDGDWAVIGFTGTQDGMAFEGGQTERMPLILGEDRLIPGFEANVVGLKPGEETEFDITFPEDYPEPTLAGQQAHFKVDLKELREKILPDADDAFAQSMGDYPDMAALKADIARAPRPQRPRPGAPRVQRQDHRVRRRQRDDRAARTCWSTRRSR